MLFRSMRIAKERADNTVIDGELGAEKPKSPLMTAEEYQRFGELCDKEGVAGRWVHTDDLFSQGKLMFIPSPRTVEMFSRVQDAGRRIQAAIDLELGHNTPEMQKFFDRVGGMNPNGQIISSTKYPTVDDVLRLHQESARRVEVIGRIIPMGVDLKEFKGLITGNNTNWQKTAIKEASVEAQKMIPTAWGRHFESTAIRTAEDNHYSISRNTVGFLSSPPMAKPNSGQSLEVLRPLTDGAVLRHELTHTVEARNPTVNLLVATANTVYSSGQVTGVPMNAGGTNKLVLYPRSVFEQYGMVNDAQGLPIKYSGQGYYVPASEMLTVGLDCYLGFQPQFGRTMNRESLGYQAWSLGMLAVS